LSDGDYELCLTNFETYYIISNINSSNNKFYYNKSDKEIVIPEGSYELHDIEKYLKRAILHSRPDDAARKNILQRDRRERTRKASIRW